MPPFLPYGKQHIDEDDINAVIHALRSDYITTGPLVSQFEQKIADRVHARYGIAVSSGTAALHAAMYALDIKEDDEVLVPAITFAATSNAVLYQGGKPIFVDVDPDTLLIDPQKAREAVSPRTKAIAAVDFAGQPCDWDELRKFANEKGLYLIADSCHALGAQYKNRPAGTLADITVFSFHPVKHITTGEGGMAVTDNERFAERMRAFRGHGITSTASERERNNAWQYDMVDLGYNYRITDLQCALGISQLEKLDRWLEKRSNLAELYDELLKGTSAQPLKKNENLYHAWHLYIVRVKDRDKVFAKMRKQGIGVNVHYRPVHLHPYYKEQHGWLKGACPVAEKASEEILTLPLWPGMEAKDVKRVTDALKKILEN